jgi:hypothetical protein
VHVNWELILAGGTTLAALVMGFLYARAEVRASAADQYKLISDHLVTATKAQRLVIAEKEEYIRVLQQTVLGSVPPGKLVERLNRMFAVRSGGAANPLPAPQPPAKPPGA